MFTYLLSVQQPILTHPVCVCVFAFVCVCQCGVWMCVCEPNTHPGAFTCLSVQDSTLMHSHIYQPNSLPSGVPASNPNTTPCAFTHLSSQQPAFRRSRVPPEHHTLCVPTSLNPLRHHQTPSLLGRRSFVALRDVFSDLDRSLPS